MTIVDGHRVTWICGETLLEMTVGGITGDVPRNVGLRVVGWDHAQPFCELFEALWNKTSRTLPSTEAPPLLFSQVYYNTRVAGEPDESFAISNPCPDSVDVSGCFVTDNANGGGTYEGLLRLPHGTIIPPQGTLYVAREAEAFRDTFGRYPDLQYGPDGDDTVPLVQTFGWGLTLTNTRDELFLLDPQGGVVDTIVYGGDLRNVSGWSGPPIPLLPEGRLLKRASPECPSVPGSPLSGYTDTDCGADWVSPRQYRPGQSAFLPETFTADRLTTFVSPDSSFGALRDLIDGARKSVRVAVYQLMNLHLVNLLCNASGRGVNVTVLLEGGPVGGVTPDQKAASAMLHEAGCTVLYLVSDSSSGVYARYDYVPAKYCVVDGESVAVMSENWVATGIPFHRAGNRGMGIIVHDRGTAGYFTVVFGQDTDTARADVAAYDPGIFAEGEATEALPGEGNSSRIQEICGPPPAGTDLEYRRPDLDHRPRFDAREFTGPAKVTPVVSPDTSLHPGTIMGMLDSAERSILVQQLEVSPNWTSRGRVLPNLYLEALLDAARRGVEVKVLLDSAYVGRGEDFDNADMVEVLRATAAEEGLNLQADLIHLGGAPGTHSELAKVHNKAIIVDSCKVLLSSINWVRGAALLNREAGLIVEHPGAARYYEDVFLHDWNLSVQRDLSMHITPGADITLLPGTTWELNLRISGTGGAMSTGPGLTNGTTLAVTIDLPAHEGGWVWGLGADGGRMAEVRLREGEEVAVRLTVTAPDNPWASSSDVEVPVFAQTGGRRSCVGVLHLHVEWSESALGALGNLSLDLEGEEEEGHKSPGNAREPFVALGLVMGVVFCLAVSREYLVRWWKGRRKRAGQERP